MSALLVVASSGPADVRFAHDAAAQDRLLRLRGVRADRIVLLARDRTDDLDARVRQAIESEPAGSSLYVYIAGHGDTRGVRSGPRSWLTPAMLRAALAASHVSHALVAVEACESGVFGRAATRGVVVLTAARTNESSFASRYDQRTGEWLGDEFSDALASVLRAGGSPTLAQAYSRIASGVWSSHPQLYGNARGLRLGDFFGG
ncbi:MAG TPA: C13 family peptidase [Gaiellaceae bacterium]|nr:C13 family peptidase [Gaiellaceae bacterium]